MRITKSLLYDLAPFVFFGALLVSRASAPSTLVFDEVHYVPAAKQLIEFSDNLNWMHPPLGKFIMGLFWLVFTKLLGFLDEPFSFRCASILFGLLIMGAVRAWLQELKFSLLATRASIWLVGFNFLWFVQSKTAMLDAFFVAPALWGTLLVFKSAKMDKRWLAGWALLGFAMAAKWAAAPYFLILAALSRGSLVNRFKMLSLGTLVSLVAYFISFVPMFFLERGTLQPADLFQYQRTMIDAMNSIASENHPYLSHWWQWPTLMRPIWFLFENQNGVERNIWGGGNPVLHFVAVPLSLFSLWLVATKKDSRKQLLPIALLFWMPMLFWGMAPRKLQMFYYFFPSSVWLGAIVASLHDRYWSDLKSTRGWLLVGFTLLCAATFLYFLPIMDARPMTPGRFQSYMWFRSWV